jgi:hypothetical protein
MALPNLLVEQRYDNGARLHLGAGVAAASCTDMMGSVLLHGEDAHGRPNGFMGDVWATMTFGGSLPVGPSTSLFADMSLVTTGLIFHRDWIGGPPAIVTLGVEHTF